MKLENEFTVPASIDEAWAVLLDVAARRALPAGRRRRAGAATTASTRAR